MTWFRESEYVMTQAGHTICKTIHNGLPRYTLWRGDEMVGIFNTVEAAKKEVERAHS